MPDRASPLAPFRHRTFRTLWTATLASNLGGLIQGVGAGWMMATISPDAAMVALVQSSTTLPIMLFSLPAGALADTFERRQIMLSAQIFMLIVSALLAVFAFAGWLTPWTLLTFTLLIGVGTALHNPSWQASMGDIVPRGDLPSAVALNSMGFNLMRSVGPAIGGIIVSIAGAAAAFAVNAVSYVALIVALRKWQPEVTVRRTPPEALPGAMVSGLRYVAMSPNLLKVMTRGFLFGGAAVSSVALMPLVARDLIQGGAFTYGILLGSFGIGAIFGALANARLRERFHNESIVRGAFFGFALCTIGLGLSHSLMLSCVALMGSGACWVLALSLFNVTVQLSTPRWVVGRALSLYQTATFGGMALGSWIWGMIAQGYGPDRALFVSALTLIVGALIGLRFGLPDFATIDLDPLDRFREPSVQLDLRRRSGPIMIMVDYEVAEADIPAFLAAMADRRRIRLRDGARRWTLLRDLENPDVWIESYHVPTWMDYVRHNQRRTKADAEVTERLSALHKGKEKPHVHRMIERDTVPLADDTPVLKRPDPTEIQ